MRIRRRPPFDPSKVTKPLCEAIDGLIRSVPKEHVLVALDEVIAYGEDRFLQVQEVLTKKRKIRPKHVK